MNGKVTCQEDEPWGVEFHEDIYSRLHDGSFKGALGELDDRRLVIGGIFVLIGLVLVTVSLVIVTLLLSISSQESHKQDVTTNLADELPCEKIIDEISDIVDGKRFSGLVECVLGLEADENLFLVVFRHLQIIIIFQGMFVGNPVCNVEDDLALEVLGDFPKSISEVLKTF